MNNTVILDVPLVPQSTDACCWAACIAMVLSWRDQAQYTDVTVANMAQMSVNAFYKWGDIRAKFPVWGLQEDAPSSGTYAYWANLLQKVGPIIHLKRFDILHARVLIGVDEVTPVPGSKVAIINDPLPVGKGRRKVRVAFNSFELNFEEIADTQLVVTGQVSASDLARVGA